MSAMRRPSWWALALTGLAVAACASLGVWQLRRANAKEQLLRHYTAAASAPIADFNAAQALAPRNGFVHLRAQGQLRADRVILLDNPHHDSRGGVEVYAPLQRAGDTRWLLVDLGFLPGSGRDKTPALPPLAGGMQRLEGLYLPPPGVGFEMGGNALAQQPHWPKTTVYLDLAQIGQALGQPLYPRVLALDPDPAVAYQRTRKLDFSTMPPARHRAYAFQWFALAAAAVAILFVVHRSRGVAKTNLRRSP